LERFFQINTFYDPLSM